MIQDTLVGHAMNRPLDLLRLMRPYQWIKNGFVLIGLLFGHAWHDLVLVKKVVITAFAFSLVSSSIYIINDIFDRERDQYHPKKRYRPLAAGTVSLNAAILLAAALWIIGLGLGITASLSVFILLIIYSSINLGYSLGLNHVVILDVFIISAGFMLRILAGTSGVGIPPSYWLLMCGFMVTLFLGFAKRRAETAILTDGKGTHRKVLDHYTPALLDKMIGITGTSVIISYSLYTMSPDTIRIHNTQNLIYTVPFVLYGIFRYIYILHQENEGGDPSRELLRDPHILITGCAWLLVTLWLIG